VVSDRFHSSGEHQAGARTGGVEEIEQQRLTPEGSEIDLLAVLIYESEVLQDVGRVADGVTSAFIGGVGLAVTTGKRQSGCKQDQQGQ
jgi:hypothetical protein